MLVNCPKTLDFKISIVRDAGVSKPGMRIRGLACPPAAMYCNHFFFFFFGCLSEFSSEYFSVAMYSTASSIQ